MTTVKEVMIGNIISVEASTPAIVVAQRMKVSKTGVIPVCENGKFRGVVTERDIVIGIVAAGGNPNTVPASSLMNKSWPIISPGDDIWHAINVMAQNGVQVLPVVQNGNLMGLLSLDGLGQRSPALAAVVFSKTIKLQASGVA